MSSKKLRIAVWYHLPPGGARRALSQSIRGLLDRGHHVEVWSPPIRVPEVHGIPQDAIQHFLPFDEPYSPEGARPKASRTIPGRIRDLTRFYQDWMETHNQFSAQCAEQINAGGFDILYATNCWRMHSPFVGRHTKIPKLLYLQEPKRIFHEALAGGVWLPFKERARNLSGLAYKRAALRDYFEVEGMRQQLAAEIENARNFDRILVNSLYSRESVIRAYGLDATFCPLGIDTSLFRPTSTEKKPYIVSVGVVARPKNTNFLIEAIGLIPMNRPKLVLVGNDVNVIYRAECDALAQTLGVEVEYHEMIPDDQLVKLLSEATALAYAPHLEPFGYAPLEAGACGTVTVAVAEGGTRETVTKESGFPVSGDPQEMAFRLGQLTDYQPFAREMGEKAREYVLKNWTQDGAIDALEKNLLQVVGG